MKAFQYVNINMNALKDRVVIRYQLSKRNKLFANHKQTLIPPNTLCIMLLDNIVDHPEGMKTGMKVLLNCKHST